MDFQNLILKVMDNLNSEPKFKESASGWKGALVLGFREDGNTLEKSQYLYLDLYEGECRRVKVLTDPSEKSYDFLISANESNWRKMFVGALPPSTAIKLGGFSLRGNISDLTRYSGAFDLILNLLKEYLEDW